MKSTPDEIAKVHELVKSTKTQIIQLIEQGRKIHVIWDFDGVLANSRSDDVFALTRYNFEKYFVYEERLLFQKPEPGPWLLPIAQSGGMYPHFSPDKFTQDIVTARSSMLAIRVYIFCLSWYLSTRWMLFLGHQSKQESYRIILESLKPDPDYMIFCIDDSVKHIQKFEQVSRELEMGDRTVGIVAPVIRTYTEDELREYFDRVMNATGNLPLRVQSPSNDCEDLIVLPKGVDQFREQINRLVFSLGSGSHGP